MSGYIHHFLAVFMGFFAIMNPIANTTVFVSLTANSDEAQKQTIARKALLTTFIIICAFTLLGNAIFHLFGISLPALRITGGILVFLIGYQMLHGESAKMHSANQQDAGNIAISPLAVPILAGPGTIATAMNYSSTGGGTHLLITLIAFALITAITYICFLTGPKIMRLVGDNGIQIMTRLMGLILAVIGTQMLVDGINGAITIAGK